MKSSEIRQQFLDFFASKGHQIVASSSLVPHDDPTLLFTNAGMNQFKDVFLGKSKRDYQRATTTQKCIRVGGKHNDLENVGHTSRHLTFFEMLGNFSFGDYFKKEAIAFAWDITTNVFGFDPKKVWVSVYKDDDEAFALWEKHLPADRLVRFGEKENFWAMGDTGPCGPCSELLYDRGSAYGDARNPYEDPSGERFLEFWNLVFMQFMRSASGEMTPLPQQSIDTGAGLERVVSLSIGEDNVFKTDILRGLISGVEEISGVKYVPGEKAPPFHVIADHIRSLSFAIADGAQPSNTDRGYVLRKILRRAVRYGRLLGIQKPFLGELLPRLIDLMGEDFPELPAAQQRIAEVLTLEEEGFSRTLQRGGNLLNQVIDSSRVDKKITGEDAFKLKDTYGFPVEEVLLIAKDEHLEVDLERFHQLEEEAKERSKKAHRTTEQTVDKNMFQDYAKAHRPCQFFGYHELKGEAVVQAIVSGGHFVDVLGEGEEGLVLLDRTCFYSEMGGQVGDTGSIGHFAVANTTSPYPGVVVHAGKMGAGELHKGAKVRLAVDAERRAEIQNHHTATHLLHWALQQVLGSHIKQAGSLVEAQRLRFDFNHHKALSEEELRQIEEMVNAEIRRDLPVGEYELSYEDAQKRTDIKQFFGEKYGDRVRVIDLGPSKELCGGTHTSRSGTIGFFKIVKEGSIAAGVRRVEAVVGRAAELFVQRTEELVRDAAALLKTSAGTLLEKMRQQMAEQERLEQELKALRKEQLKLVAEECFSHKEQLRSVSLIVSIVELTAEELPLLADEVMKRMPSGIIALGAVTADRCQLLVQVSNDVPMEARRLIQEIAPLIQGGGGGTKQRAQAGGKKPSALPEALHKLRDVLLASTL